MTTRQFTHKARGNALGVATVLETHTGMADLYRTTRVNPESVEPLADLLVGRVRYAGNDGYDLQVIDPIEHEPVGYLSRAAGGRWAVYSRREVTGFERARLVGYAATASVGADVLVNGAQVANERSDARTARKLPPVFVALAASADATRDD